MYRYFFLILLAFAIAVSSCSKPQQEEPANILVSPNEVLLEDTGGTVTVQLTATRAWAVTAPSWLTVSPSRGEASSRAVTITLSAPENPDKDRTAAVQFSCAGLDVNLQVTQKGKLSQQPPYLMAQSVSVSEFIKKAEKDTYYKLTGTIGAFNKTAIRLKLTDGSSSESVYVYEVKNGEEWADQLLNGGKVTVSGKYQSVSGQIRMVGAYILSFEDDPSVPRGGFGFDKAPQGWLELPATVAGDGLELLVHAKDGKKYVSQAVSGERNWSCYWDFKEYMSLWVAYPLNTGLIGKGSRTDKWGPDPLLPESIQPNITVTYGGGWSRGHQLPSADRLNYEANVSTFYPTNITPQNNDFNSNIWEKLESRVRTLSKLNVTDTLYVVTGALYKDSKQSSESNTGFAVRIPTHYFKALLFRGSASQATQGFMAAGFLFPHSASIAQESFRKYILSIDELEEQTGIDFFPNLEALIGKETADAIEAESPSSWW